MEKDRRVVLTVIVGELLHIGHIRFLQRARALGDFLVVGVLSDELTFAYKKRSPVIPVKERIEVIGALRYTDAVYLCDTFDDQPAIKKYGAKFRVFAPEEPCHLEAQRKNRRILDQMTEVQVVVIPRTPNISSTIIREKINRQKEGDNVKRYHCGRHAGSV